MKEALLPGKPLVRNTNIASCFVVIAAIALLASMPPHQTSAFVHAAVTDAQRAAFTAAIARADAALSSSAASVDAVLNATNPADDAASCVRRSPACGPEARALGADYVIDFSRAVQSDYDFAQSKAQAEPPAAGSREAATLCRLERMRDAWRAQLTAATGRRGDVLFQYYADAASQGFAVYPPLRWDCAAGYVPARRPWYVAGAAGQKDLVIAVDVSDDTAGSTADPAARVAAARAAAAALLDSLSFRDYVALVPYTTFADLSVTPELVQATAATVALLQERVRRLAVVAGSRSRVAAAVEGALGVLDASAAAGATSRCSRMVALLSGGVDTAPGVAATDPAVTLARRGDTVVVAVHVLGRAATAADAGDTAAPAALRRLACASRGLAAVADAGGAAAAALRVNSYLARVMETSDVRWSEVYQDAFGQGRILSGARALYNETTGDLVGITAVDLSLQLLTANDASVTEADINTLSLAAQSCDAIDPERVVRVMQGSTCANIKVDFGDRPSLFGRQYKGLLIAVAFLVPVAIGILPCAFPSCRRRDLTLGRTLSHVGLSVGISAGCWLVFLVLFVSLIYDDAVDRTNFDPVSVRTIRQDAHPYRCCEKRDCTCQEAPASTGNLSCGTRLSELTSGVCSGGYRCCEKREFCCLANGDKCIKTCTECLRAVQRDACRSACGTCTRPTATIEYVYDGATYTQAVPTACGLNETACVEAHWATYPTDRTRAGFVDPSNPNDLRFDLALNIPSVSAAVIFAVAAAGAWAFAMYQAFGLATADTADVDDDDLSVRRGASDGNLSTTTIHVLRCSPPPESVDGVGADTDLAANNNNNNSSRKSASGSSMLAIAPGGGGRGSLSLTGSNSIDIDAIATPDEVARRNSSRQREDDATIPGLNRPEEFARKPRRSPSRNAR